jgi:hypothetical protein
LNIFLRNFLKYSKKDLGGEEMDNQVLIGVLENEPCPAVGYQSVSVCVPVSVKPFAKAGPTVTTCCGEPVVKQGSNNSCKGTKNGTCTLTITQDICVKVPVVFGATTEVGDTYVECKGTSGEDICRGCGKEYGGDE